MKTRIQTAVALAGITASAESLPAPAPELPVPAPPAVAIVDPRAGEKPVRIVQTVSTVEENAFFERRRSRFSFVNPNARVLAGDFEFPLPDGAFVCGYALEIGGAMVPGVVCEKEKARVAFETEVKAGVDPGLVEHVKGDVWRTRIFPLEPEVPRSAEVEYVVPKPVAEVDETVVFERDGDDVFAACAAAPGAAPLAVADKIAAFPKGVVLWDASASAKSCATQWLKRLEALPEAGEWTLVEFRDVPSPPAAFTSKAALLAAVGRIDYDGGTDIARAVSAAASDAGTQVLLFSDEIDTLGLQAPEYEDMPNVTVASRPDRPPRKVVVEKLAKDDERAAKAEPAEGTLLATAWAAERIADLSGQAGSRKEEFLALGRKYGVAGPATSLVVLETLDQYLRHGIEPPESMPFHSEWARRRAASDDAIAAKRSLAEHEAALLALWEERIKWWNDPKPRKPTPKSGLFDRVAGGVRAVAEEVADRVGNAMPGRAAAASARRSAVASAPMEAGLADEDAAVEGAGGAAGPGAPGAAGSDSSPAVKLTAWKAGAPYVAELEKAAKGGAAAAYRTYLGLCARHGSSPAFYMDAAGVFFGLSASPGDEAFSLGVRVLSNMAEFKLENAAVWRAMGWRLREAGAYGPAVVCFRKALALRGEEGQSRRDLALVLMECGKRDRDAAALAEAMELFKEAAFGDWARRSGRRSNDRQVSIVALEELNGLIAWCERENVPAAVPPLDEAFRRDMPVKLRIVMSWDADETDIDIHVLEPDGEEAFYGNRRTSSGGFVSEDVTTGYGPEEYLKKDMDPGTYKILSNYYASHQSALTGPATVTVTVYTDWGTGKEKAQIMTLRLDKPKDRHPIGEVSL